METALAQLGEFVDVALDAGRLPYRKPSTIVDLTTVPPSLIREGPVSFSEILDYIRGLDSNVREHWED